MHSVKTTCALQITRFVTTSTRITLIVFTLECILKIFAEGNRPDIYFTDKVRQAKTLSIIRRRNTRVCSCSFVRAPHHQCPRYCGESLPGARVCLAQEAGPFNCFDFTVVVAGLSLMGSESGGAVGALRLLRLLRLLSIVKSVPQLTGKHKVLARDCLRWRRKLLPAP